MVPFLDALTLYGIDLLPAAWGPFRRFYPHDNSFPLPIFVSYRMIVELHRKVSSLIEFLKQKWELHEVRIVSFSY